jgi:large subunit ribosomal protein L22
MKKNKQDISKKNLVTSINKNVRSSTRKIGLVLRSVVGKKVEHALRDLSFGNQRISKEIMKTINSAVANAENNFQYDIDNLFIKEAYCGKSIVMKRFRPRAKGRASPIKKPYSKVTIILSDKIKKREEYGTKS